MGPAPLLAVLVDLGTKEGEKAFLADFETLLAASGLEPQPAPGGGAQSLRAIQAPVPGGLFYGAVRFIVRPP